MGFKSHRSGLPFVGFAVRVHLDNKNSARLLKCKSCLLCFVGRLLCCADRRDESLLHSYNHSSRRLAISHLKSYKSTSHLIKVSLYLEDEIADLAG